MENNAAIIRNTKSDAQHYAPGDYLSEIQYYKIVQVYSDRLEVENERGFKFFVTKGIAEEGMYSNDQYDADNVQLVTRTELIEKFVNVGSDVFTVNFNKQPTASSINEAISLANKGKFLPIQDIKQLVKKAYEGEERTLVGYLLNVETGFGRSLVIDLKANPGNNPSHDGRCRQVDHRTLNWLIWRNVKYQVK